MVINLFTYIGNNPFDDDWSICVLDLIEELGQGGLAAFFLLDRGDSPLGSHNILR